MEEQNNNLSPADDFINPLINESALKVKKITESINSARLEIKKYLIGQDEMIDLLLIGLLSNGHILLEGVPGIAKTLTAKLLAKTLSVKFSRIQFTPDLMPSDVIGTSVFNQKEGQFIFRKGPVFANIVLIDEINRAPAKTHAALFDVMDLRLVLMTDRPIAWNILF